VSELNDALAARITELCDSADDDVEHARYDDAIEKYHAALALVPAPQSAWRITMWILTALGEAFLFTERFEDAQAVLMNAMEVPGATANPFLHLRLGQAELGLGNTRAARDELTRALRGGGELVFEGEDAKLLAIAKANLGDDE